MLSISSNNYKANLNEISTNNINIPPPDASSETKLVDYGEAVEIQVTAQDKQPGNVVNTTEKPIEIKINIGYKILKSMEKKFLRTELMWFQIIKSQA
jgi:hypothetical protein